MAERNKIVLIAPPPSDPTQPYSSLPALTGFLRARGLDVIQIDLGLRLFDESTTPERLRKAKGEAISRRTELADGDHKGYLEKFCGLIGLADYIIAHVDEAKRVMRDPIEFYDLDRYDWASSILKLACELYSLPNHPSEFKPYDYFPQTGLTFGGLIEATSKRKDNVFHDVFEEEFIPEMISLDPFLIGLSITYNSQIIPGFTLARLIRKSSPKTHVCIGGAAISQIEHQIMNNADSSLYADSYIIGEGETALYSLANNILNKSDLKSVPNIIFFEAGKPIAGKMWQYEEISDLPLPDFSGLELKRYLTPELVFLISSSRGCYYGKCAFCNVSMNKKRPFRSNAKGETTSLIRALYRKYGVKRFFLCDDAIPLPNMMEIARFVIEEAPSITWAGEARFETGLSHSIDYLKTGGCRQLILGLESVSQSVLDIMNKRNTVQNDVSVLKACQNASLAVNLQTFIGFPTETREEAWKTIEFIAANERALISYGYCTFDLCRDTPVFENPERYGVSIIPNQDDRRLSSSVEFEKSSGMTVEETESVYKEGLELLEKTFRGRTNYLCKTAGAHVLLHLSHFDWEILVEHWKRNTERRPLRNTISMDATVQANPHVKLSYPFEPSHTFSHRALDTETGIQYFLSSEEQKFLEYCSKPINVKEVIYRWVKETCKGNGSRTLALANATIIINRLFMNRIIRMLDS